MKIDMLNPYVIKIIITAREEDSINSIAGRINLSYGWTYKWCKELIKLGVFDGERMKLKLNKKNKFYRIVLRFIRNNFSKDINFYYSVLGLFGVKYSFTKTDSVFVWTKGGYNIARYRDFYPVFIRLAKKDYKLFKEYCVKLGLKINGKKNIFYCVKLLDDFEVKFFNNMPVDSLNATIKFMKKYKYNFQPALEMVKEIHGKKLRIKYKEFQNG